MTLKKQIIDQVQEMPLEVSPTKKDIDNYNLSINNLEKIADYFAIGFAEWCIESEGQQYNKYKYRNRKELLEIYKKEKEL